MRNQLSEQIRHAKIPRQAVAAPLGAGRIGRAYPNARPSSLRRLLVTDPPDQPEPRMHRAFRRLTAHVTYGVATAPMRARTWYDVRLRRRHLALDVVMGPVRWSDHVAVVAVLPRRALAASVLRLLDALRSIGATVVVVANESADTEWCLEQWRGSADALLRRPNIGRDFGAYQAAMRFIAEQAPRAAVRRVSFFNDSVVYPPSMDGVLAWLRQADGCTSLTTHGRPRPHLQSYAFSLESVAAFGSALTAFWRRYYPSNVRHRVVRRGELALSDVLRREGRPLRAHVTAARLAAALGVGVGDVWCGLDDAERASVAWASALDPRLSARSGEGHLDVAALLSAGAVNTTHAFGLVAARLLGMPLKLDLARVGAATLEDVSVVLRSRGMPDPEVAELLELFAPAHGSGALHRIWQSAGLW